MNRKIRFVFIGTVTLLIWAHLGWDYFHEGVPSHTILVLESKPEISNWWGGIVVPLLTWFLLYRIQHRLNENNDTYETKDLRYVAYGFFGSLLFGILFPYFYLNGHSLSDSSKHEYVMLTLIFTSFFIPLYRAEYLLGLVIGMTYALGPIIPIGVGIILVILFAVTYKYIRTGILYIKSVIRD
jgi:hypothetical protein